MKKQLLILSMTVATLGLSGCMYDDAKTLPPGHYEHTSNGVDNYGTAHDQSTSTDVYYDANGDKRVTRSTKTTTDPKGLFNKSTTETESTD